MENSFKLTIENRLAQKVVAAAIDDVCEKINKTSPTPGVAKIRVMTQFGPKTRTIPYTPELVSYAIARINRCIKAVPHAIDKNIVKITTILFVLDEVNSGNFNISGIETDEIPGASSMETPVDIRFDTRIALFICETCNCSYDCPFMHIADHFRGIYDRHNCGLKEKFREFLVEFMMLVPISVV